MSGRRIGPTKPQPEVTKRVTSEDREYRVNHDPNFTALIGTSYPIARIYGTANRSTGKTPVHTVSATLNSDGSLTPTCTCQSFRIQKNKCKHLDSVRDLMAVQMQYDNHENRNDFQVDILDVFLDWVDDPKEL